MRRLRDAWNVELIDELDRPDSPAMMIVLSTSDAPHTADVLCVSEPAQDNLISGVPVLHDVSIWC